MSDDKPVRVGVVGPGGAATGSGCGRGSGLMKVLLKLPGVTVTAVYDTLEANARENADYVKNATGFEPTTYSTEPDAYERLLGQDDVDAVLVATPTKFHARMSIDAMKAGKHVASEVPGGYALEELWELVETKEQTGMHYTLLENDIYDRRSMMILNMAQQGYFGEPYYGECGYLHEIRFLAFHPDGRPTWREEWYRNSVGNNYPTHSLGPLSKWFGINETDRFESCVSMMTKPRMMHEYAVERFGPDSPEAKVEYKTGDFIRTMIQTVNGGLITVDIDMSSPRPMERFYLLQGNKGIYSSRSDGIAVEDYNTWKSVEEYAEQYDHPIWKRDGELAKEIGWTDFFTLRDFVTMVREDREPWLDVYDGCTWSSIFDCSRKSLAGRSALVEIPDFSRGKWKDPNWRKDNIKP